MMRVLFYFLPFPVLVLFLRKFSYYEELKKREESHPGSVSPGLMREMRFYSIIYGIIVVIVVAVNLVFMMLVNTGSISNM